MSIREKWLQYLGSYLYIYLLLNTGITLQVYLAQNCKSSCLGFTLYLILVLVRVNVEIFGSATNSKLNEIFVQSDVRAFLAYLNMPTLKRKSLRPYGTYYLKKKNRYIEILHFFFCICFVNCLIFQPTRRRSQVATVGGPHPRSPHTTLCAQGTGHHPHQTPFYALTRAYHAAYVTTPLGLTGTAAPPLWQDPSSVTSNLLVNYRKMCDKKHNFLRILSPEPDSAKTRQGPAPRRIQCSLMKLVDMYINLRTLEGDTY